MFEQLGLIGCGLMGGSFALALKRAGLVKRVVGYSKSPSTTQKALHMGVIDIEAPSALMAVSGSDFVLLAVPVSATEAVLKSIRHIVTADMLLMDVGSTKSDVVAAARRGLRDEVGSFIPAHPIAGREVSGIGHANADLYNNCQVILTPFERSLTKQMRQAQAVWEALGCKVQLMSPQAHDAAYAAVSHFPHLMACALVQNVATQAKGKEYMTLAGSGFRDTTRIAAGDPQMWRDIFLANKTEVLAQSRAFVQHLQQMEQLIENDKSVELEVLLRLAQQSRKQWRMKTNGSTESTDV
jgi:prephenate dehydrogenase